MIRLKNVNKYFYKGEPREVHALRDINLSIKEEEFTLFSGPSGCGKTTLLNVIGALDGINSGEIYLGEREIASLDEDARTDLRLYEMGFVFQAYNLVPVLNVEENIGFIMRLQGFGEKEGISILFASHDNYILKSVRRVIKMNDGAIIDA
jgi:putative ABC transport system ATP-binding protein